MQQIGQPLKNGSFTRTYGAPSHDVWPRFFMDTIEDVLASERAARGIYKDVERVEFNMPGNPFLKPVFEVTDEHRQRWPDEYAKFKAGQEIAVSGTPVEHLPFLKRSMVLELKALGFLTVEHLAAMNDHAVQQIPMYGRRLKQLAESYLDDAKALAALTEAQAEADRKDAQIAALTLQVENMSTQLAQLFTQFQDKLNQPNPLMTHVPGLHDPMEAARMAHAAPAPVQSAFEGLPDVTPRKRKAAAGAPA